MGNIKLIVGLANPGSKYSFTRHNIGGQFVERLAKHYNKSFKEESKFLGYITSVLFKNNSVYLLLPKTFMNLSGASVLATANFYHISSEEIFIIHDEMQLPPGLAKFKKGGGHGGHNGLKDIMIKLNDNKFYRLRIGIGYPANKDKITEFVLTKPSLNEQILIDDAINEAIQCIEIWIKEDEIKAIHRLHSFKKIT